MNSLRINKIYPLITLILLFVFAISCDDEMDKHYDQNADVSVSNLMEQIDQRPELSTYASMLRATGMDAVLTQAQSYTVWAPTNDVLGSVDMTDMDALKNAVSNYIARHIQNAVGSMDTVFYMINQKYITVKGKSGAYFFGGESLLQANIPASNGVLHIVGGQVPFLQNIWQYMTNPGFDSIRTYLYSFDEIGMDITRSKAVDIDTTGMIVYDTVFTNTNTMLYTANGLGIGALNREDSLYTMVMPTNEAWKEAYNTIKSYYKSNNLLIGDSIQNANTKYAIVRDLVYRGALNNPSMSPVDSLVSTRNSVFYAPGSHFNGTKKTLSNGLIYITNQLTYAPWESWHKKIVVEAEYSLGREYTLSLLYSRGNTNWKDVSNFSFLDVQGFVKSARPTVTFEIPNTLSAAYNIYCVFIPRSYYERTNITEKTRVKFDIQQRDTKNPKNWKALGSNDTAGATIVPEDNTTSPTEIKKMLIYENFIFPYANYNSAQNDIRIKVSCAITTAESNSGYSNNMLIDYIVLEPVQQ